MWPPREDVIPRNWGVKEGSGGTRLSPSGGPQQCPSACSCGHWVECALETLVVKKVGIGIQPEWDSPHPRLGFRVSTVACLSLHIFPTHLPVDWTIEPPSVQGSTGRPPSGCHILPAGDSRGTVTLFSVLTALSVWEAWLWENENTSRNESVPCLIQDKAFQKWPDQISVSHSLLWPWGLHVAHHVQLQDHHHVAARESRLR